MSPRSFARPYAARLGRTPARTVEAMRFEAARRAVEETDLPLKSIAAATVIGGAQTRRRVFLRHLGVSPDEYCARFSRHGADDVFDRLHNPNPQLGSGNCYTQSANVAPDGCSVATS